MRRGRNPSRSSKADDPEKSQVAKAELAPETGFCRWMIDRRAGTFRHSQTFTVHCLEIDEALSGALDDSGWPRSASSSALKGNCRDPILRKELLFD